MESFKKKFKVEELLITKVGAWNISLRPAQVTIGSLVLSLDRECPVLGGLTIEDASDLGVAFKEIEKIYNETFQPDKINYLALMMVDEQVHFHVIPRYSRPVIFQGQQFPDKNWPMPTDVTDALTLNDTTLLAILDYFKRKK